MKNSKLLLSLSLLIFITGCRNQNNTKDDVDTHSRGEFAPVVYTTTGDGTWTGPNWTPAPPPNNLSNVAIIINHTIDYTTVVNINNWNKSDGSVTINSTGTLNINTNNNSVIISNGFQVFNFGNLLLNMGTTGQFKIDKAGILTNTGTVNVIADKVFILEPDYADTSLVSGAQIINSGTIDMSNSREVHNDGYIENSGYFISLKMHNDGYICNSSILEVQGETKLHDNDIGFIGCGGALRTCIIEMDGGKIFDQSVCCLVLGSPSPPLIDSSNKHFNSGDYDHNTVTTCALFLATGITQFQAKVVDDRVAFLWEVTEPEVGDLFIIQRSTDAIEFEDRMEEEATNTTDEVFTAEDEIKSGLVYYRLKIVNISDGSIIYSSTVSLTTQGPGKEFKVYPNPSTEFFSIAGEIPESTTVEIIDMNGRTVYNNIINFESNNYQVNHNLNKGVYILRLRSGDQVISSQKIIVQ